jgi:hypothetical protein
VDDRDFVVTTPFTYLMAGLYQQSSDDHAILFASMILASPEPWGVKFIYMDGDHPTWPETMNHVIVQVDTSDGSYLVEAMSKYSMNPYEEGVYGWFFTIDPVE